MQNTAWSPLETEGEFCKLCLHWGCLSKQRDENWPSLWKAPRPRPDPSKGEPSWWHKVPWQSCPPAPSQPWTAWRWGVLLLPQFQPRLHCHGGGVWHCWGWHTWISHLAVVSTMGFQRYCVKYSKYLYVGMLRGLQPQWKIITLRLEQRGRVRPRSTAH